MSSRIGGGFEEGIFVVLFAARAELTILSRGEIPKCAGSGSCWSRTVCKICQTEAVSFTYVLHAIE
jgi:hypothetical protein